MKQTVAAYIAKTLESAGVKRIWGVACPAVNQQDALPYSQDQT